MGPWERPGGDGRADQLESPFEAPGCEVNYGDGHGHSLQVPGEESFFARTAGAAAGPTPYRHAWAEGYYDAAGAFVAASDGRTGTTAQAPLYAVDGSALAAGTACRCWPALLGEGYVGLPAPAAAAAPPAAAGLPSARRSLASQVVTPNFYTTLNWAVVDWDTSTPPGYTATGAASTVMTNIAAAYYLVGVEVNWSVPAFRPVPIPALELTRGVYFRSGGLYAAQGTAAAAANGYLTQSFVTLLPLSPSTAYTTVSVDVLQNSATNVVVQGARFWIQRTG